MVSIKQTEFYDSVKKELSYTFGKVYLCDNLVVSEIDEGTVFSWEENALPIINDVLEFYGTDGNELTYISNRINSYSVVAQDWLKFFKHNLSLKAYYIVTDRRASMLNLMVENLFFKNKIKRFESLNEAINYLNNDLVDVA